MSAAQVRALLNGCASTEPEVQEQLNAAFASMSRAQLYDIMREWKGLIAQVGGCLGILPYWLWGSGLGAAAFQQRV